MESLFFENIDDNDEVDLGQVINILMHQQRDTHDRLQESNDRFAQFADVASDWLWEIDANLVFTYISSMEGGPETLLNKHAVGCTAEIPLIEENKVTIHVEVRGQPFFDENRVLRGYRGSVLDVTPRKAAEARAKFLALHDELTRLPSRRALNEVLPNKLMNSDKNNTCLALAGIDLEPGG